jgi:hypothetical protein
VTLNVRTETENEKALANRLVFSNRLLVNAKEQSNRPRCLPK